MAIDVRGRVARMERLRRALEETAGVSAAMRGDPDPDFQHRWAAHQQLAAVIAYLEDEPKTAGLIPHLHQLQEALLNVENGRSISWLKPRQKPGAPPLEVRSANLRGRYAAVMHYLMGRDLTEREAGKFVCRHGNPKRLMNGAGGSWRVIQDWRQKVIGKADDSPERSGFGTMLVLIAGRGDSSSRADAETAAKELLRALDAVDIGGERQKSK